MGRGGNADGIGNRNTVAPRGPSRGSACPTQLANGTMVSGAGVTFKEMQYLPQLMETSVLMPEPANPADAATDVRADIGWQSAAIGQQRRGLGVAGVTGDFKPNDSLFGLEPGSEQAEMRWTDGDFLDVAALFAGWGRGVIVVLVIVDVVD